MSIADVRHMLEIGDGCGLHVLDEAYGNYMNHWDCFFSVHEYAEQVKNFNQIIIDAGLTNFNPDSTPQHELKDLTIQQALEILSDYESKTVS